MNYKGQTLVEVLVAMTVGVLVLTAITSSVLTSLVNSRVNQEQNLANQFAQEGMEIARASRSAAAGTYCLDEGETRLSGLPEGSCIVPNVAGSYIRTVNIYGNENNADCGTDVNRMVVTVQWTDSSCSSSADFCHEITLDSCANVVSVAGTVTPTPTLTPTPVPQTLIMYPTDDNWVEGGTFPNVGDPDDSQLIVGDNHYSYIKFDLTGFTANQHVTSADLNLTTFQTRTIISTNLKTADNLLKNSSTPWTESNITWNSRPDTYSVLQVINSPVTVDVTDYVQSRLGSQISFGLDSSSSSDDSWYSSDYSLTSFKPRLTITTQGYN